MEWSSIFAFGLFASFHFGRKVKKKHTKPKLIIPTANQKKGKYF